ncbi:NACHT domain-containing protein [Streptomyces griseicoloratus]|uniref:NACHT domain-containing protein n=1 Tax=Streptomyces griseicoloratus TaxID=2752516 RepID=UPI00359C80F4
MSGWEPFALKLAAGALRSVAAAGVRSILSAKPGASTVANPSTGRFKNRFFQANQVHEKDIKAFSAHVVRVLAPLLETEFRDLPHEEAIAAAAATESSFSKVQVDPFENDFNAATYAQKVTLANAESVTTAQLSDSGEQFYHRLVHEISAQLLNFITTWPSFLARANLEQLQRTTELAKQINAIKRSVVDDASEDEVRFEERYASVAVRKLDQLELFGVTLSDPEQRSYPLSAAYISLALAEVRPRKEAATNLTVSELMRHEDPQLLRQLRGKASPSYDAAGGIRSEQALASFKRILLRGEAGSGKTTLLHWIAVNAARRSLEDELGGINGFVPFFLPLRRFAATQLPAAHDFLSELGKHLSGEMPPRWVNRVLASGQALVLIDGVDELPENRRGEAKEWLQELVNSYPEVRYIVTSRPAAAEEAWLIREGFTSLDMLPMSPSDIEYFIQHWHAAVRESLPSNSEDADLEDLERYEEELTQAIRSQAPLRKLASNPLLCALLCTLSRDRRMQLPRGRMELYTAALEMLLVRRDVERRISHDDAPELSLHQKQRILGHFAHWLIRNNLTDARDDQAVTQIGHALTSMPRVTASAHQVFKYLMVRSGLLRQPVDGRVDFIHRTFQEYLAAANVIAINDIRSMVENAHKDQWHEVVIMAVGHARPQERGEILDLLIKRGDAEPHNLARLHLLAAACLESAEEVDPAVYEEVRLKVESLIPPSRVSEAKEIAAVGEAALNLLPRTSRRLTALKASATVRTASLIGGDSALDILAGYGADHRTSVYRELTRAWTQFDLNDYAEKVMSKSPIAAKRLRIANRDLLETLSRFPELGTVECEMLVEDFNWLRHAAPIKSLVFRGGVSLSDVENLVSHESLEGLVLLFAVGGPSSLQPLSRLPRLSSLTLHFDEDDEFSMGQLPDLPHLADLHVVNPSENVFADAIGGKVPQLTNLSVGAMPERSCNLTGIGQMATIKSVMLNVPCVRGTVVELNELPNLEELYLLESSPDDWEALCEVKPLKSLYVYCEGEFLTAPDFSRLNEHTNLTVSLKLPEGVRAPSAGGRKNWRVIVRR